MHLLCIYFQNLLQDIFHFGKILLTVVNISGDSNPRFAPKKGNCHNQSMLE